MGLYEILKEFQEWTEREENIALSTEEFEVELQEKFKELAPAFLYGGYIKVFAQNNKGGVDEFYRIYIHTVEFYFHCEEGSPYKVKDPIVYHQNIKSPTGEYPYFPTMTLNAHSSGYDITFENAKLKYRASALIREYSVYDIHKKEEPEFKTSVWALYDYINGFSLEESGTQFVKWVDFDNFEDEVKKGKLEKEPKQRKNVYRYEKIGENYIIGYKQDGADDFIYVIPNDNGKYDVLEKNTWEKKESDKDLIIKTGKYIPEPKEKIVANLDPRKWSFSREAKKTLDEIREEMESEM